MKPEKMTVHQVAELTGITIRALHYYDEIGLLKPTKADKTKYRLYSENDLEKLQQILFYREVGFSLKEIKELLSAPIYSKREALERHSELLMLRKKKIEELICLVNDTLAGKNNYSFAAFSNSEISALQEKYRNEVIERWGSTHEYQEFSTFFSLKAEKERNRKWNDFLMRSQGIFERLAEFQGEEPTLAAVQSIVVEWQEYISENFYPCSDDMLMNLGALYQTDERFSAYINRFATWNVAEFLERQSKSIVVVINNLQLYFKPPNGNKKNRCFGGRTFMRLNKI